MAKNSIADWSKTAEDNTDVGGIAITGSAPVSNFDGALREMMSQVAETDLNKVNVKGNTIASGSTTDLSLATGEFVHVTGTAGISGLGTSPAGVQRVVMFEGEATISHNATSLILPGASNIGTMPGDVAIFLSEGGGNWRCISYLRASYVAPTITPWVAYTPTFVGIGTPGTVFVYSRRVGGNLEVTGQVYGGTPTAAIMSMTLGFKGVNGGLTISNTFNGRYVAGVVTPSYFTTASINPLLVGGTSVVNFGVQSASRSGTAPAEGNAVLPAGEHLLFKMSIPIDGWN